MAEIAFTAAAIAIAAIILWTVYKALSS